MQSLANTSNLASHLFFILAVKDVVPKSCSTLVLQQAKVCSSRVLELCVWQDVSIQAMLLDFKHQLLKSYQVILEWFSTPSDF